VSRLYSTLFPLLRSDPTGCRRAHTFTVDFEAKDFFKWEHNELLGISLEWPHKLPKKESYTTRSKTAHIPILYAQLLAQLIAEDDHSDHDNGHESLRRQAYARQVLDAFGREIRRYTGEGIHFRSAVLNPILQRYRQGVPDAYAPAVSDAISGDGRPTINEATQFYLAVDPVDSARSSEYRRNLVYIPEARWYLRVLLGKANLRSARSYNAVLANHEKIMAALAEEDSAVTADSQVSHLNAVEVQAILEEDLEDFFEAQFKLVVRAFRPSHGSPLTWQHYSLSLLRR